MASRNSPARRIPGSPLAGVLRQTARAARSTTRRSVAVPGPQGEEGPRGPAGPTPPGPYAVVATTITTDATGVAAVSFDQPVNGPVVSLTPFGATPVVAVVADLTAESVTVATWSLNGVAAPHCQVDVLVFGDPTPVATPVDWPEQPETEGP